ncbi:MAG: ribonuclease III [Polyangiaceae bacterium]|nr:ribonuclease III [Polyangiaceae bacterium]
MPSDPTAPPCPIAALGLPPQSALARTALTHPSHAHEHPGAADNQRLEFLGDSVLGLCASELLFARFAGADEGFLTQARARLVSTEALAAWARGHGVPEALETGRGGAAIRESPKALADAVEALLGAAFLEGGLELAGLACRRILEPGLAAIDPGAVEQDPKSALQEALQGSGRPPPVYELLATEGPAHRRSFVVAVSIGGERLGEGRGSSKRSAERVAAGEALHRLGAPRPEPGAGAPP